MPETQVPQASEESLLRQKINWGRVWWGVIILTIFILLGAFSGYWYSQQKEGEKIFEMCISLGHSNPQPAQQTTESAQPAD